MLNNYRVILKFTLIYFRTSQLKYVLQDVTETDIPTDLCDRITEEMRYEMVRTCKYHSYGDRFIFLFLSLRTTTFGIEGMLPIYLFIFLYYFFITPTIIPSVL